MPSENANFKVRWIPALVTMSISLGSVIYAAGVGQGKVEALENRVAALEEKMSQYDQDIPSIKKGVSVLVCKISPEDCLGEMRK